MQAESARAARNEIACILAQFEFARALQHSAFEARYEATPDNVAQLASRVIEGGVGAWGDVPMASHSGLTEAAARDLVRQILALK